MTSPSLHLRPINVLVWNGPQGVLISRTASHLDAFSAYPGQTRIPGGAPGGTTGIPEVCPTRSSRTSVDPLKTPTPTIDRDRTVSRRSEPSSRATLMGEQPNPWDLLQPQDVTSRHRGAKPPRRYELLGISLLSPEYLLSFERRSFHTRPPDHYAPSFLPARDVSLPVKRPYAIALCKAGYQSARGHLGSLRYAFGGDHPSQTARQAVSANHALDLRQPKGRISTAAPPILAYRLHSLRPILHIG